MSKQRKQLTSGPSPREKFHRGLDALKSLATSKAASVGALDRTESVPDEPGLLPEDEESITRAGLPSGTGGEEEAESRLRNELEGWKGQLRSEIAIGKETVIYTVLGIAVAALLGIWAIVNSSSSATRTEIREQVRDLRTDIHRSLDGLDQRVSRTEDQLRPLRPRAPARPP